MLPRRPLTLLSVFALCAFVSGCASPANGPSAGKNPKVAAPSISAQLRPGDSLSISLLGIPEPINSGVQIDEQGTVRLPYIGSVTAAGLTLSELSQTIRDAYLTKKYFTQLDVSVAVTERYVYIGGEVQRPGRIVWSPDLTLAKAIQSAGGFTLYAKETKVMLSRDRKSYDFDVRLAQRNPDEDPLLFPGDSIQVARSAF
ncbi:MAG: polysaccharide export protein [Opitutae bacterium]|nr:polysaccharide export protein [Opitutae bacterium]